MERTQQADTAPIVAGFRTAFCRLPVHFHSGLPALLQRDVAPACRSLGTPSVASILGKMCGCWRVDSDTPAVQTPSYGNADPRFAETWIQDQLSFAIPA